ncbi:unnamed protein product, partial [Laminaria digitata]
GRCPFARQRDVGSHQRPAFQRGSEVAKRVVAAVGQQPGGPLLLDGSLRRGSSRNTRHSHPPCGERHATVRSTNLALDQDTNSRRNTRTRPQHDEPHREFR